VTEPGLVLVLGFIGLDPVHRDNSRALINDLILAFKKTVKRPQVLFYLDAEGWSTTMAELCDFALTSGYGIGLIGPSKYIDDKGQDILNAAEGNIFRLTDDQDISRSMVDALSVWPNSYLVIIADPEEDDDVFTSIELASAKGIRVRTLLHGMDKVTLEENETLEEEETPTVARKQVEEEEFDQDEADVDYDDEDLDEEDDENVVEAEFEDEEDEEEEPAPPRKKRQAPPVVDEDEEEDDDGDDDYEDSGEDEESDQSDSEEDDDDEEEEESVPTDTATTKWTTAKLQRLSETDREQFKAVAASYGILPGRGIKSSMMIDRILVAQKAGKTPKKIPARKVAAPVKKAAAKKTAPAPVKKATSARKTAPVKEAAPAKRAPAASNGHVDKALLKAALSASRKFAELAESLV
jgi:hypothetical protein